MAEKIEFQRWKDNAEVANAAAEAAKIGDKYLQYASSDKNEDKIQARKLWKQLSDKYWDILFAVVDAQTESFPEILTFDEEERLFIDFGFLNDHLTPRNKKFDPNLALQSKAAAGVFQYQAFSDFIAECWGAVTKQPIPDPVCGMYTADKMKQLEEQLAALQGRRDAEVRRHIHRPNNISELELDEVIDDLNTHLITAMKVTMRTKEYREAKDEPKQAMSQCRFRYYEAERVMNIQLSVAQRDEEDPLGLPELEMFMDLHESTKTMARKIIYTMQEEEKNNRRAKRISDECSQFSQQMMRKELKNMIGKKRDYMAVPAKVARCEQSLFCPFDSEPALYETLSKIVEEMSNLDIEMFAVPRIRMYGIPRVIFIPGQGWGTYDWLDHTILLPMFPTVSVEKALAYGVGTFRWDSDEDRLLKNAYENIKDNRGKSILDMASSFYKDYFLWITKEKKGYRILPRETHKAFNQMFARKQEEI
ncbi:MAG: hypothetical protein FWG71_03855 [Synergistaceae bacterium]|nr:hypothetical protein [Synergistaceae bacterium]